MLFLSDLVLDFQCLYFEICEIVPIYKTVLIMQTCPCNVHPLTPHFYLVRLWFTGDT